MSHGSNTDQPSPTPNDGAVRSPSAAAAASSAIPVDRPRYGTRRAAASNASTTPGPGRPSHTIRAVGTAGADPTRTRSPLVRAG